jgi:hypothetical protein
MNLSYWGRQVGSVDCNITVGKICRTEPYFSFGDNIKNDKIVSDCIEENGSIWGVISISKCIQIVLVDCGIWRLNSLWNISKFWGILLVSFVPLEEPLLCCFCFACLYAKLNWCHLSFKFIVHECMLLPLELRCNQYAIHVLLNVTARLALTI